MRSFDINLQSSSAVRLPAQRLLPAQAELEDLSFAVLHPAKYCRLRMQLDRVWQLPAIFQPPQLFHEGQQGSVSAKQPSPLPAGRSDLQQQKQQRQAAVQTLNDVLYSFEQLNASG